MDMDTNTVYVGNLSWSVDNEALETLFWEHGNVMKAKVFYDKDSGKSRGFGFVTYSCADEVYSAVESLDGVVSSLLSYFFIIFFGFFEFTLNLSCRILMVEILELVLLYLHKGDNFKQSL